MMKDLRKDVNTIILSIDELVSIIREYVISEIEENVEIIKKKTSKCERNADDIVLDIEFRKSVKVLGKRPEFSLSLQKNDILECLNTILSRSNEKIPYNIVDLTDITLPNGSAKQEFTFAVQRIYEEKKVPTLAKKG